MKAKSILPAPFPTLLPVLPVLVAALVAGCSDSKLSMPYFGDPQGREVDRKPTNATEYRCDGNKVFYTRAIDGGALWLIAPDREIRLEKLADNRWGVARVQLETSGDTATLADPPSQFTGCKKPG